MRLSHVALCCVASALWWVSQALAGETVELRIDTVLATNASQDFDARLIEIRPQLRAFRYSSYRLVQEERRRVGWGTQADFNLPGGRFLQVVPKGYANERIVLQVMLIEGTTPTPLMNTSLSIRNHGNFLVGGRKHQEGMLIIRIGAVAEE
jgi:hypothetical protein